MNETWTLAVNVTVTGLLVVFLALIALTLLIFIMGKIISAVKSPKKPAAPTPPKAAPKTETAPAPAAAAPQMAVEDGVGDEVIAVISAVVAALMDEEGVPAGSYAVRSVKRAREARPIWGFAGMQQNTRPF